MRTWAWFLADRRRLAIPAAAVVVVAAGALAFALLGGPPTTVAVASHTANPTPTASPSPSPSPSPTPRPTPTPSPTPRPELADGRLTVLVLGSDSSAARRAQGDASLTDAITLVSLAADGSDLFLVSLPRDSTDFPMPDGSTWHSKANAIVEFQGAKTMKEAMADVFGMPIDYFVLVDMDDFSMIVDAVGGVTVQVPYTLADQNCTIGAGTQHLNGALALCFARNRHSDSDYARAGRHQQLLLALRDQLLGGDVDLPALVASLHSLQTDVEPADLPVYAALLASSTDAEVQRLVLEPPDFTTFVGIAGSRGWISIPNLDAIHQAVAQLVSPPATP